MQRLRELLKDQLHRRGYYVTRQRPYQLDWQLRELFARLGVNCVIDVGGHWGEYGSFLRMGVGYRGRIVSFEPMQESVERLTRSAAGDTDWQVKPLALGEAAGTARLHTFANTVFNSLLPPTGEGSLEFGDQLKEGSGEEIQIRTLDEVIDDCTRGIPEPRVYLKLDTQGYDQQVIAGGRNALRHVVALQTEVAVVQLYQGAPTIPEAVDNLNQLGFAPVAFFPVNYEADGVNVVEFDCVLARRPVPARLS